MDILYVYNDEFLLSTVHENIKFKQKKVEVDGCEVKQKYDISISETLVFYRTDDTLI